MSTARPPGSRTGIGAGSLLFLAHPGHELRVFGWIEAVRPLVCVLTDGSGGGGVPRIEETRTLLQQAGARVGPVFGRISDRALYELLLRGEHAPLLGVAAELAALLAGTAIGRAVGDAVEGFNPAHDVARLLLDAAVGMAGGKTENLEFALEAAPQALRPAGGIPFPLDDVAFARKLEAVGNYRAMAGEVEAALSRHGEEAFRTEWFFRVGDGSRREAGSKGAGADDAPPFYETFGERRVREGTYSRVLRRREHVDPLAAALRKLVEESGRCGS
jgi:hypothetical protein